MSTATRGAPDEHVWVRTHAAWDLIFALLLTVVAVALVADGAGVLPVVGLVVLGAWYLLTGRPAIRRQGEGLALLYLLGAYALFTALAVGQPSALLLLVALYPQTFALLGLRRAVIAALVLAACTAAAQLTWSSWSWSAAAGVLLAAVLSAGFSIALGTWIHRIIEQSRERARLIEELHSTREQLARSEHEQGELAERQRMASEIHDTLAQGFASVVMLAQAAHADSRDQRMRDRLGTIEATARESLAEARAIVAALAPADLQGSSLPEALGRLAARTCDAGLRTGLAVEGMPRQLAANSEVVLLRAAQEALANVRKHAGATSASLLLCYDSDGAALEVLDDGSGFDVQNVDGFGLRGMCRRANQVGGHAEVRSIPGGGTTVRVRVP